MRVGGLILCGGNSRRMTMPKARLPFGDELMLNRVVRQLSEIVRPIVVVAAAGQLLPELPSHVHMARDRYEGLGPLAGLEAGLSAIQPFADAAYATSCDAPLLSAAFARQMIRELGFNEVAIPVDGEFHHPLAGVYRTSVLPAVQELLAAKQLRPFFLFERVTTRRVPVAALREVDPELRSLINVNYPADYFAALRLAGIEPDPAIVRQLGSAAKELRDP